MNIKTYKTLLIAIGIPTLYALVLRLFFGFKTWDSLFSVMSVTFLYLLPTIVGALTVYLSSEKKVRRIRYRILTPWIPIFLFMFLTLGFAIEGWACWLMILPVFLIAASIGGLIGGYLKLRATNDKLNISILVLLPLFISPIESMVESIPGNYKAYTYIDIDASAEKIWDNVSRVKEIPEAEDKGYLNKFLGFPRPIKAELNYEGVGAYREAIFTNGLVFHETVTEYKDNEKMVFDIKAHPHEIPSTTLDEHITIGGNYFDVLNGTYELETLENGKHRLHLYSHFKVKTTFNFYAGWWAKWIMKDIQNNILQVQKRRSEEFVDSKKEEAKFPPFMIPNKHIVFTGGERRGEIQFVNGVTITVIDSTTIEYQIDFLENWKNTEKVKGIAQLEIESIHTDKYKIEHRNGKMHAAYSFSSQYKGCELSLLISKKENMTSAFSKITQNCKEEISDFTTLVLRYKSKRVN